jgi:hypothetical protein
VYIGGPHLFWALENAYTVRFDGQSLKLTLWFETARGWGQLDLELTTVRLVSGGERTFFVCPGLPGRPPCGARVAKLYWPVIGGGVSAFACRTCHQLAYASSQARPFSLDRMWDHLLRPIRWPSAAARAKAGEQVWQPPPSWARERDRFKARRMAEGPGP